MTTSNNINVGHHQEEENDVRRKQEEETITTHLNKNNICDKVTEKIQETL